LKAVFVSQVTHIVRKFQFHVLKKNNLSVGGLSLSIEGPSKTEIKCNDNGDGTCTVSYIPTAPGEYNITVKFSGQHISGSPFTSKITCKWLIITSWWLYTYRKQTKTWCKNGYLW